MMKYWWNNDEILMTYGWTIDELWMKYRWESFEIDKSGRRLLDLNIWISGLLDWMKIIQYELMIEWKKIENIQKKMMNESIWKFNFSKILTLQCPNYEKVKKHVPINPYDSHNADPDSAGRVSEVHSIYYIFNI